MKLEARTAYRTRSGERAVVLGLEDKGRDVVAFGMIGDVKKLHFWFLDGMDTRCTRQSVYDDLVALWEDRSRQVAWISISLATNRGSLFFAPEGSQQEGEGEGFKVIRAAWMDEPIKEAI